MLRGGSRNLTHIQCLAPAKLLFMEAKPLGTGNNLSKTPSGQILKPADRQYLLNGSEAEA